MNKYFDNILFYLQKSGGGSVYWGEIVKRFNCETEVNFIQPNLESSNIVLNDLLLKPIFKERNIPLKVLRYLPITVKIEENSIFHSSYYRYCNQSGIKNVVTVHDFIYEYYYKGLQKLIHSKQKGFAIKKAKGIICISNSTKADLLKFFPDLLKGKITRVIYNGISSDFKVINNKSLLEIKYEGIRNYKFILYIGHRTKYKNFDFAVQVVKDLPKTYKLIIVGNTLCDSEMEYLKLNLSEKFIFFGNVTNSELNDLYNISECLIYPSSYEGFGIPIIEAFKCGCPVVAQNIPAIKEIAENAALLIDGLDILRFRENILSLNKESIKSNLVKIGLENSKKYSWDKCFSEVKEFYNSI